MKKESEIGREKRIPSRRGRQARGVCVARRLLVVRRLVRKRLLATEASIACKVVGWCVSLLASACLCWLVLRVSFADAGEETDSRRRREGGGGGRKKEELRERVCVCVCVCVSV
ncbi:hypothetical protein LX36DRAFT_251512 [Colletotrichum falcatum]|nr:hypothetical protein LX36DRAFT_251512 [Colletotrichum falcatum]